MGQMLDSNRKCHSWHGELAVLPGKDWQASLLTKIRGFLFVEIQDGFEQTDIAANGVWGTLGSKCPVRF
jgi:hypothetical protein